MTKKPAFVIKFTYNLLAYLLFSLLERTILRADKGYYSWPNRPWSDYITERDHYYNLHKENQRVVK